MEFRITALLSSRNMKVRDFKSKVSCCFNSECDVIEVVCYLINMSASYSRIGAFCVIDFRSRLLCNEKFPQKVIRLSKRPTFSLHKSRFSADFIM